MKAIDFLNTMTSGSAEYIPETSVDRIIIGNPMKEIKSALVTWICSLKAVETAVDNNLDMIVTHEPTFWIHRNEVQTLLGIEDGMQMKKAGLAKKKLIEDNDLVVVRIHDVWDAKLFFGMADSWARFLGFDKEPVAFGRDGMQRRYDIQPVTLEKLAKRIAGRTAKVGEPLVQMIGDGGSMVSRVCLGPGYGSTVQIGMELGCDVNIMCDDGSLFWSDIQCAVDMGYPIIRVNHGTSEEPGTIMMSEYISKTFPELKAVHFPLKPYFKLVGP